VLGTPSVVRSAPPLRLDRERRTNVELDTRVVIPQADARKTILEPRRSVSITPSVSKLQQKVSGSLEQQHKEDIDRLTDSSVLQQPECGVVSLATRYPQAIDAYPISDPLTAPRAAGQTQEEIPVITKLSINNPVKVATQLAYNKREELSDELKETPKIVFGTVPSVNSNLNQIAPSESLGLNLLHSLADSNQSSVNSSIDFSDFVTAPTVATSLDTGGNITSITDASQPRGAIEVFIP
jgi:hypothetical protein